MEYHRTKDILHIKKILGHKQIRNPLKYIDLEAAVFGTANDEFSVRVANNVQGACALIEAGLNMSRASTMTVARSSGSENDKTMIIKQKA